MRSFTICRICEQFPPMKGGLSSGMYDLSMAQYKKGHTIIIITRAFDNDKNFDSNLPFTVIRVQAKTIAMFGWKAYDHVKNLPTRPDIIHGHGPAAFSYLFRRKRTDPKIICTIHAVRKYQYSLFKRLDKMVSEYEKRNGLTVIKRPSSYNYYSLRIQKELFIERYICKKIDHLAVVAEYFARQINDYYKIPLSKTTVIYNGSRFGLDADASSITDDSSLNEFGIDSDKKIILYIGRVDWVKRVHLLVEAMPKILKIFPDACLVVAGLGDQFSDLKMLTKKLNLTKNVMLLGWVQHDQLPVLLKRAQCFCLPSYWEGLSKALLEAMSMEVPIIATNNPSNREILRDGSLGWLVSDSSENNNWETVIIQVLSDPILSKQKTKKGMHLLDEFYRWNHVAGRLDEAYDKLLD